MNNPMALIQQFQQFKNSYTGNPQQQIQLEDIYQYTKDEQSRNMIQKWIKELQKNIIQNYIVQIV